MPQIENYELTGPFQRLIGHLEQTGARNFTELNHALKMLVSDIERAHLLVSMAEQRWRIDQSTAATSQARLNLEELQQRWKEQGHDER